MHLFKTLSIPNFFSKHALMRSPANEGMVDRSSSHFDHVDMTKCLSHRFGPLCLPALPWLLAEFPKLDCVDCFFLGAHTLACPLKAFVGSSLLR